MKLTAGAAACVAFLAVVSALAPVSGLAAGARAARVHYACSTPNSAHEPCRFSTPSGNIRCLWTPHPNNVACELLSGGRAYRLRPSGRARAIKLRLARRGETLPTSQEILFTDSLSCHDTRKTMTCNQDYGEGEFTLAPGRSHSA
jgi:hypothetical protein